MTISCGKLVKWADYQDFHQKIIPKLKKIGDYSILNSMYFAKPLQLIVDFVHDQLLVFIAR